VSSTNDAAAHGQHDPYVAHHFTDWDQQRESSTLGMWLFLAQEVMFFGGMFCAYVVYRVLHGEGFAAGSGALNITIGGINTTILLTSSLSMAMAVYYAHTGQNKKVFWAITLTQIFGLAFLLIKLTFEYAPKFAEGVVPGASWMPHGHYASLATVADQGGLQMYFVLYYIMTSMHALHMVIGMGIMGWLMWLAHKNHFGPKRYMAVENFGLYWHFVDIVWVFLFPMFYIIH
jgi:cytochrome c oxidase subunit 3